MVRKTVVSVLATITILLSLIIGSMVYHMANMSIEHLVLCSIGETGTRIPVPVCSKYMETFRTTVADINEMENWGGISYILGAQSDRKYAIAEIFIAAGLDINGEDHYAEGGVNAAHAAVLVNNIVDLEFLIKHGMNLELKSSQLNNMTPLELAINLQKKHPKIDRSRVIQILKDTGI